MKIAFASSDGIMVAQHFGRARRFAIIVIDESDYSWDFLEIRENDAPCGFGEHDEEKLSRSVGLIADCKALFAVKAGEYARARLNAAGVRVLEKPGYIKDLTGEYIRYLKRPLFGGSKRREVIDDHPCFSEKAHNSKGRLHMPISPACNIQCRFCTRSRDGDEL
ncbi:MAG: hypothetical protein LBK98_03610, partial [Peptococcaceae bacterium]|nr:hypothetical protein [Peptococcaceae bacterium]